MLEPIHICQRCKHRSRVSPFKVVCGIDQADIIYHAITVRSCPVNAFDDVDVAAVVAPPVKAEPPCLDGPGPGSIVKRVLSAMGYKATGSCGCEVFCRQMNEWGWLGCSTTHRAEVVAWFTAKAKEQDITINGDSAWALVVSGIKGAMKRDPAGRD